MSRQDLKNKRETEKKRERVLNKKPKAKHQLEKYKKQTKTAPKPYKTSYNASFAYQLYLYRRELERPSVEFSYIRRSRAKIVLTAHLIAQNIGEFNNLCSVEDLKVLSREVQFKKRLCTQVERMEQYKELGLTEMVLNGKRTPL